MQSSSKSPKTPVSIIVPFRTWDPYLQECVSACGQLDADSFDVSLWLLSDDTLNDDEQNRLKGTAPSFKMVFRPTGKLNPAAKRNIALRESPSDLFALIDADAYPRQDWLSNALTELKENTRIVAGPNMTPPQDPLLQRVTGRVMESPLGFGAAYIRHTPVSRRYVNEMPTCNMVVRRVPGILFREDLDTAEDMMYCADIRKQGYDILYTPDVVVFHHRRRLGIPFIKQFFHYGLDKGKIAIGNKGANYLWQAAPAGLLIYFLLTATFNFFRIPDWLRLASLIPGIMYLLYIAVETNRRCRSCCEWSLTPIAFVIAHCAYGTGYLRGFLSGLLSGEMHHPDCASKNCAFDRKD